MTLPSYSRSSCKENDKQATVRRVPRLWDQPAVDFGARLLRRLLLIGEQGIICS